MINMFNFFTYLFSNPNNVIKKIEHDKGIVIERNFTKDRNNDAHIVQLNRTKYNAPNLKKILINKDINKIFHYARADLLFIKKYLNRYYEKYNNFIPF